jgi:hypothetical protein
LKKQSQFAGGHVGVSSYLKGSYGYTAANGARENKANCKRGMLDFIYNTEDCHGPSGLAMTALSLLIHA